MRDDGARSVAARACFLRLQHAKHALARANNDTCSPALGAHFGLRAVFGASAVAVGTCHVFLHFELLRDTLVDFLLRQSHLEAHVGTATLLCVETAKATAETAHASTSKDVGEASKDVAEVYVLGTEAAAAHAVDTSLAKAVVAGTLLLVAQHVVGLGRFLKHLLGFFVARVAVGVVFDGGFLVCPFNFVGTGRALNAQYLVIVFFHGRGSLGVFYCPTATFAWRITLSPS